MLPLPNDPELEDITLAGMVVDNSKIPLVLQILKEDDFYCEKPRRIFRVIKELAAVDAPVDWETVRLRLPETEKELLEVLAKNFTPANTEYYATQVRELSKFRKYIVALHTLLDRMAKTKRGEYEAVKDEVLARTADLVSDEHIYAGYSIEQILSEEIARIELVHSGKQDAGGIQYGYYDVDRMLIPMKGGQLIVIAGRTGMGKTTFALNIAANAAARKVPVLMISLEMAATTLTSRLLCREALVNTDHYDRGFLSAEEMSRLRFSAPSISALPIRMHDQKINFGNIISTVSSEIKRHKCRLVVIDYIQMIQHEKAGESRQVIVSEITRSIKQMATKLNIPIVGVAQLNRQPDARENKRPALSDLRESGSIEQEADVVILLYRDDAYHEDSPEKGICEVLVAKQRIGKTGMVKLNVQLPFAKFDNLYIPQGNEHA